MHEGNVFDQKLLEKAYFIFKMTGPAMVQPASSDFWKAPLVFVLARYLSYRESTKRSNEMQGPTLGVRFSEVSVEREVTVYREPRFTDTVTGSPWCLCSVTGFHCTLFIQSDRH